MRNILFIGRFQPPHFGHKKTILRLLKSQKKLTIAIGSSNKCDENNPFSAKERLYLLKKIIPKRYVCNTKFAFLADNKSNAKWVSVVAHRFPKEKYVVVSANKLVRSLLKKAGYVLDHSSLYNRKLWEGKKIRSLIRNSKDYSTRIPSQILKTISKKSKKLVKKKKF